ncbi:MAG: C-type lectin domain-containing protein [Verrucomicrobiota bacterium]
MGITPLAAQENLTVEIEVTAADELIEEYIEVRSAGFLKIYRDYHESLSHAKKRFQTAGDLETSLWVSEQLEELESEVKRVERNELVPLPVRNDSEEASQLSELLAEREASDRRMFVGVQKLNQIYLPRAEEREKSLVQKGELELAIKVREFGTVMKEELEIIKRLLGADATAAIGDIPTDASSFQGHYYKVFAVPEGLSREEAKRRCEKMGGYLACVETQEEDQFLIGLLDKDGKANRYWLGGESRGNESRARWINGEPFTYTSFQKPDNDPNPYLAYLVNRQWAWRNNEPSLTVKGFICEWAR